MKRLWTLLMIVGCTRAPAPAAPTAAAAVIAPARTLQLTYLGVAGWQLSDGEHVLLVDPYFSRPKLTGDEPLVPDGAAITARAPARADLVMVGHSHFDHALDVPLVALHTGAEVLGSESTANLARASGVPAERVITVRGGEDFAFSGFSVRVLPSLHSALEHKHAPGAPSVIPANMTLPLRASEYLEGGTLAYLVRLGGKRILILSTANFIERELEGLDPDVAIVATGLREEIYDYECRLMHVLDAPPLVLTNHFDAWREPYVPRSRAQLDQQTRADLDRFEREIRRCAPGTRVVVPTHGEAITLR